MWAAVVHRHDGASLPVAEKDYAFPQDACADGFALEIAGFESWIPVVPVAQHWDQIEGGRTRRTNRFSTQAGHRFCNIVHGVSGTEAGISGLFIF